MCITYDGIVRKKARRISFPSCHNRLTRRCYPKLSCERHLGLWHVTVFIAIGSWRQVKAVNVAYRRGNKKPAQRRQKQRMRIRLKRMIAIAPISNSTTNTTHPNPRQRIVHNSKRKRSVNGRVRHHPGHISAHKCKISYSRSLVWRTNVLKWQPASSGSRSHYCCRASFSF